VPDWPLEDLEKPRVDWIIQDGEYAVFGDLWQTAERTPSLAELGGTQLYSEDPSIDRRPALQTVFVLSYFPIPLCSSPCSRLPHPFIPKTYLIGVGIWIG